MKYHGKEPGGQKRHEHHLRKAVEKPDNIVEIPAPAEYTEDPNFKGTGRTITNQAVTLHISVEDSGIPEPAEGHRMHANFTFGRMNGKQASVMICASGDDVLYQGREKKGDEGVKGSPLEFYKDTLISDHEAALVKHGYQRQECMEHVKRYTISSIQNEKKLTWNKLMKAWLGEANGYWNSIREGGEKNPELVDEYLQRYDEIMETARREYEDEPPLIAQSAGVLLFGQAMNFNKFKLENHICA